MTPHTINLPNILLLRNTIANAHEDLCVMRRVDHETKCGTAHCIAGWAATLWPIDPLTMHSVHLSKHLGISISAAVDLMLPNNIMCLYRFDEMDPQLRKAAALHVLDHLSSDGRPKWREALEHVFPREQFDYITQNRFI